MSQPMVLSEAYAVSADSIIHSPMVFVERADSCWVPKTPPLYIAEPKCVVRFRFVTRDGSVYIATLGKRPRYMGSLWGGK